MFRHEGQHVRNDDLHDCGGGERAKDNRLRVTVARHIDHDD